jgi:hypothetical protein
MIGTLLSFSAAAVGVRALSKTLSMFEILALRNAAGIVMLLALAWPQPVLRATFRARRLPLHFLRKSCGQGDRINAVLASAGYNSAFSCAGWAGFGVP